MVAEAETSAAQEASVPRGTLRVTSSVAFGSAIWPGNHRIPAALPGRGGRRHAERPRGGSGRGGVRCCGARRCAHRSGTGGAPADARPYRGLRLTGLSEEARRAEIAEDLTATIASPTRIGDCITSGTQAQGRAAQGRVSGNLRGNNGDILVNATDRRPGRDPASTFLLYEALQQKTLVRILFGLGGDELSVFVVLSPPEVSCAQGGAASSISSPSASAPSLTGIRRSGRNDGADGQVPARRPVFGTNDRWHTVLSSSPILVRTFPAERETKPRRESYTKLHSQ